MKKSRKTMAIIIINSLIIIFMLLSSSCSPASSNDSAGLDVKSGGGIGDTNNVTVNDKGNETDSKAEASDNTENTDDAVSSAALTSTQAAALAYEEAKKWHKDPVLWYISPIRIDKEWEENDRAFWWTVAFANPENESTIFIYIHDGIINGVKDVGNIRHFECKPEYKKDRPATTMKEAVKVALANGAFKGLLPDAVTYEMESIPYKGRFVWSIVYRPENPEGKEDIHFYYVDGITGEFIKSGYKSDGEIIERTKVTAVYGDDPGSTTGKAASITNGSSAIYELFHKINYNRMKDALALLNKDLAGNQNTQKMWIENFKSIKSAKIKEVKEGNKSEWKADREYYDVIIEVDTIRNDENTGWSDGDNKRWFTVVKSGGKWVISEISTGG